MASFIINYKSVRDIRGHEVQTKRSGVSEANAVAPVSPALRREADK